MNVFRTYEYNGMVLQLAAYECEPSQRARASHARAPGSGRFEIERLDLAVEGEQLTLAAQIRGRNIAYIYSEILLKDEDLDRFYGPVAREHLRADRNKETGGISRPDWDDPVELTLMLYPSLSVLTDGVDSAFCFSTPERYGSQDRRLGGLYTPADGAAPLRALFIFDNAGEMKGVFAYGRQGRRSGPHMLTPERGDRFIPLAQVLTPPAAGGDWETATALSTPLTFRDGPLGVVEGPPMPGDYLVGLLIQDLDGGLTREYVPLTVGDGDIRPRYRPRPIERYS
jgi:hypothetical protein